MAELKTLKDLKADNQTVTKAARDFVNSLLDDKSFVEMDTYLKGESLADSSAGEGVVSGMGRIDDQSVMIFCQNPAVMKGALGNLHLKKIKKCIHQAVLNDIPLISVIDTQGVRLDEGMAALNGFAAVMAETYELTAPHIAVIKGSSYGLMSYFARYADIVVMLDKAVMATTSPLILNAKAGVDNKPENYGAKANLLSGACDLAVKNEAELKAVIRQILRLVDDKAETADDANRVSNKLNADTDVKAMLDEILDKKSFLELMAGYGEEIVTGVGTLGGMTVGVVANNSKIDGGRLTEKTYRKIERVSAFCDNFGFPVVNFVNSQGVAADAAKEKNGLTDAVFAVIHNYVSLEYKVAVITGSAVGAAYVALASKDLGYDYVLGWEGADISVLDGVQNAEICYTDEIAKAKDKEKARAKLAAQYKEDVTGVVHAAQNGLVDNVIAPGATRPYLIALLQGMK